MKDSEKWVRQPKVDKAADEVVEERGCHPSEVKPNWVAKKLGVDLNGAISEKVFDWRRRRLAEMATSKIEVPPQLETALREQLDQFNRDVVDVVRRTVQTVVGDRDLAATLRINDAERRRDQAEVDRDDVVVSWREADKKNEVLEALVADLQQQLEEARNANNRLLGRLEQREHDEHARKAQVVVEGNPENEKPRSDMAVMVDALINGPSDDEDFVADGGESDGPMSANPPNGVGIAVISDGKKDHLATIDADRSTGSVVEMPPAIDVAALVRDDGDTRG